jgi:8-oxo-dGTP pyrophosphatase MutT (NUDIX family)
MPVLTDDPITPVPSATVIVLRDSPGGPEVLLGKRRGGRAFGDAHVFPGGVIDPDDRTLGHRCQGLAEAEAGARLGIGKGALDYWVAAIREVFEETGLAFMDVRRLKAEQLIALRQALLAGECSFAELCKQYDLALQSGGLHYVAHWITPVVRPVRFDTRFFLAELPPGQRARHDGVELIDSIWLTPAEALSAAQRGELQLAWPTRVELQRLRRFSTVSAALAWAAQRWQAGVPTNLPVPNAAVTPQQGAATTPETGDD